MSTPDSLNIVVLLTSDEKSTSWTISKFAGSAVDTILDPFFSVIIVSAEMEFRNVADTVMSAKAGVTVLTLYPLDSAKDIIFFLSTARAKKASFICLSI